VRALLRREKVEKEPVLRVRDLTLSLVTHRVTRGEKEIELTSKEYALLEYMMRNPDKVLTRAMISEHVWDYQFDSITNVIDVYVNYLRKKIDKDFETKLIHTIRGVGYVIKGD
ncbi:MAG: DNA-binding response regulator, partial [Deltaproteobacteria bacterium]